MKIQKIIQCIAIIEVYKILKTNLKILHVNNQVIFKKKMLRFKY